MVRTPPPRPTGRRRSGPRRRDHRLRPNTYIDEDLRREMCAALTETKGSVTEAAELLGLNRTTLHERIKRYGIDLDAYRSIPHPYRVDPVKPSPRMLRASRLAMWEFEMILDALRMHNWHRTQTAEYLGISARCLRYKLKQAASMGLPAEENPTRPSTPRKSRDI